MIWVVNPDERVVVVHTAEGSKTFSTGMILDGGSVFPGFMLPVDEIFNL